ncbi:hypothetical protein NP233_g813 [Leucocoprinus birnbaumii]|uniref:Epoxide hydrolase N-terminal domain-containing protein n=1 Tax=Leucocoprinus birnbaumii TaxID=56174 RepID=A0AAD5W274_9AGAR|nr:hypothetical protein NP233_g813 [Leucocoprinus birnbaumii]
MATEVPFRISVSNEEIDFLKKKLNLTRLPDEIEDAGRDYGAPLQDIQRLTAYWKDRYDWRKHETQLNEEMPQFTRDIEVENFGTLNIHYVHKKSPIAPAIPLLFVHGWPGSFLEVRRILPLLVEESSDHPSFHVVALSLPGYGFSEAPRKRGFSIEQYAEVFHKLMLALGYDEYVTQGGDWGAVITQTIAAKYGGKHSKAWHTNMPIAEPPHYWNRPLLFLQSLIWGLTPDEKAGLGRTKRVRSEGLGYVEEQSTQPQTLGYSLADSPVGLLGWIYEKLLDWTDDYPWTDDEVLTWISIYWFSRPGPAASIRIYYEFRKSGGKFGNLLYYRDLGSEDDMLFLNLNTKAGVILQHMNALKSLSTISEKCSAREDLPLASLLGMMVHWQDPPAGEMKWCTPTQSVSYHISRPKKLLLVSVVIALLLPLLLHLSFRYPKPLTFKLIPSNEVDTNTDYPPSYGRLRSWEGSLPQHNLSLPYPEGRNGRFVRFSVQIQQLGWNNCLNEILMNSYLAYKSKRAYVFQDYVWKREYYPWPEEKRRTLPPRTPLNALIAGPTAGGPWGEGDDAPRSVTEEYYDIVCPESERRIINTRDVKPGIVSESGKTTFYTWQKLLLEASERCIEVQPALPSEDAYSQIFDLWLWGTDRILDMWEEFRDSPVSQLLETSPIVNAAVARNEYLFVPRSGPKLNPYDRMLAIHIRRGDFKEACLDLATWNATFYSWNLLPFLPDNFIRPPGGSWGKNTDEDVAFYMERCLPDFDGIVKKIADSRNAYVNARRSGERRNLDTLYILTNDDSEWLHQLKDALRGEGWSLIVTSKDLILHAEGVDTNMAVDMDIARRAAVFIGNGVGDLGPRTARPVRQLINTQWSSFTSNIVHRRLVDGKEPISIRFY